MSARNTAVHLVTKAGTLFGALFLVGVLLAAIPAHKSQSPHIPAAQESQSTETNANTMPGMDMSDQHGAEAGAVLDMASGAHDAHSLHMYMTAPRPQTAGDMQRPTKLLPNCAAESKSIRTSTLRSTMASRSSCPTFRSLSIISRATKMDYSER
jgi:hypothetical protein